MALLLAVYSLWNGENLEGIGWFALVELSRINHKLGSLPKKRDPKSEAKELASLFQASFDKQSKDS
tara:strand:- start:857 stop:1054 length:198 start_codon:yes stop_codon:yes gene_type:complete